MVGDFGGYYIPGVRIIVMACRWRDMSMYTHGVATQLRSHLRRIAATQLRSQKVTSGGAATQLRSQNISGQRSDILGRQRS